MFSSIQKLLADGPVALTFKAEAEGKVRIGFTHRVEPPKVAVPAFGFVTDWSTAAADLEKAMAIMVEAAQARPRGMDDPAPGAFLESFADSGINLQLGFWIRDPHEGTLGIRSAINMQIWRRFKEEGIEIPFPQREVRVLGNGALGNGE